MTANALSERYDLEQGMVQLTGVQALLRLLVEQQRLDRRQGLRTAAFVSGYPGSPLGGFDALLMREARLCADNNIVFQPGLNEELAATSVMGSQIATALGGFKLDGVWGLWFGKTPGLDRALDALKHASYVGTGQRSGVVAVAADDPGCKSSTIPSQSEQTFIAANMPVLFPGNAQEVVDLGLAAFAMSRYAGTWVGLKLVTDVADGGGTVQVGADRHAFAIPAPLANGSNGPHRCFPPQSIEQEGRVVHERLEAAKQFARANRLNRIVQQSDADTIGIISAGKSYFDLVDALAKLGLTGEALRTSGIRILKLGMTWPLDQEIVRQLARGVDQLLVVEEKRPLIEEQLRQILYDAEHRPAIFGKTGPDGAPLLPRTGELSGETVRRALLRLPAFERYRAGEARNPPAPVRSLALPVKREAWFCSGCPHNRSTQPPQGALVGGGIGCHTLSMGMDRNVQFIAQMGGEGAAWIGVAPFVEAGHFVQHVGDGTYFHSGSLGIRAAVAAGINITFKVLFNRVVAMTGGQHAPGGLTLPALCRALAAEGVVRIEVVAEDPQRYRRADLPSIAAVSGRDDLERVQRALQSVPGVTVIVYDQECALEKRRKRKRAPAAKAAPKLYVAKEICEACGDCAAKSNCISLGWGQTWLGPKVEVQQSTCNADWTCLDGECPSFFTVKAGVARTSERQPPPVAEPRQKPALQSPFRMILGGIGGTGVVTINAIVAEACKREGKHDAHLDQTGMAQKGGSVVSHLTIAREPIVGSNRVGPGEADLLLGFDVLTVAGRDLVATASRGRTRAIVSTTHVVAARQVGNPRALAPTVDQWRPTLQEAVAELVTLDAEQLTAAVVGDTTLANVFVLGVAYQKGYLPLEAASIEQAIAANGVRVQANLRAFGWGRAWADDPTSVVSPERRAAIDPIEASARESLRPEVDALGYEGSFVDVIVARAARLVAYQHAKLARAFVATVFRIVSPAFAADQPALAEAIVHQLFRFRYIKDEYEVARLARRVRDEIRATGAFGDDFGLQANLSPPLLRAFGYRRKIKVPGFLFFLFAIVAWLRRLRGGPLDLFAIGRLRRRERRMVAWSETVAGRIVSARAWTAEARLRPIVELLDGVRGYAEVRERNAVRIAAEVERALDEVEANRTAPRPPIDASRHYVTVRSQRGSA